MKIRIFIVLFVLSSIILFNSSSVKADDTVNKQHLTFSLDDYYAERVGWGPFSGVFSVYLNLPDDYVFFELTKDGEKYVYYAWLQSDGTANNYQFRFAEFIDSCTYVSDTVSTSNNIYSLGNHLSFTDTFGNFVNSSLPYFNSWESAKNYLENGVVSSDTCLNYKEQFKLPTPEFNSIYNDSNNRYKFYINFTQDMQRLVDCKLQYKINVDMISDEKEYHHEQYYTVDCNNPQNLIIDLSEELVIGILDNEYEYKKVQFEFLNRNYNGTNSSDTATITISESMNGIHYTTTGFPNITYPQNYQLLYDTNGVVNDMFSPIGTGGSTDLWQGSDISGGGFVNSIVNGFGLYGDNGLISLLRNMFSFIPADIWNMIAIAIGAMIVIVLFKLFIS